MTFHICGQCQFFQRESHPDDDTQTGICYGWEPALVVFGDELIMAERFVDPGRRACVAFREDKR